MSCITFDHRAVDRIGLALVRIEGIVVGPAPPAIAGDLAALLARLSAGLELDPEREQRRAACREMLRNGRYKPTGRGKPASEYLLRAAREGTFPRINGPVDAINLVSLSRMVPVSLWDLEAIGATDRYALRLGAADEGFQFNAAGQRLALADLVCGCAVRSDGVSVPAVTPIKDSLAAKIRDDSRRLAACAYLPLSVLDEAACARIADDLRERLAACGAREAVRAVLLPGRSVSL